ncbi:DNA polymerase/3'-5' exonuclease PolX [Phenylobacterium montanum]|uniref:DNA polymerase beta n=1 Tax=Phenylobacterium montanum TaxID=2823693 RepID=A0A975ITL3_9CAUL|nr:DNA polymerase/3'-5' exonuclease PolX [Caulobacter sp. S6]QUD86898.1 DNA polymerase/3'-5' exonuclease PolX [Caulobacter sp. S6]
MAVHNADIVALFERLADLLEIEEANPFRVRAYRRAAMTLQDLPESAAQMVAQGRDLTELPGIGDDLAAKIKEVVETGRLRLLGEVEARTPSTLAALTSVPGLGPKRVHQLYEQLGISTLKQLEAAARAGRLRGLPRFGAALEAKVIEAAGRQATRERRLRISTAEDFARGLETWMKAAPGVGQVVVCGSYRRRRETVGDLDILATAEAAAPLIAHFTRYDEVAQVVSQGPVRSAVRLKSGLQVDLRVVPDESYGAALVYFTGSKAHNIALRRRGQERGLKVNEYGVFQGDRRLAGAREEDVYRALGLDYVDPVLREDRGEIEAAANGDLPRLLTARDIRGDLHAHTRASDGKSSLAEMAAAAAALAYEYVAITDHSRHATIAHGLDPARLAAQIDEIDRLNETLQGIRVLKSSEVDILADGRLDLPDALLDRLDLVVCAVHYQFGLDRRAQTERIVRAMDNRRCNIIAHPSGRLIEERPGYEVDLEQLIEAAAERGCFLELNAHPSRLDLDDVNCRFAKAHGVKIALGTDAHSTIGLGAMRYGVDQARRGWLEPGDVLNTRPWPELKRLLAR